MALFRFLRALLALLAVLPAVQCLTVHLVPHTHDDVGWLKTVDQYFIGSNNSLQHASVTNLITAVVAALQRNPDRRFIYAEQAFFQRWWRQQTEATQAAVRHLVSSGQLEFVNGGWCMHDEAGTHYVDMIDQTTLGHQYILSQFGPHANPSVGWQVDPFGHSATQAALLSAEVGLQSLFFGRIDYQDHQWRVARHEMQFSWAPSPSLGPTAAVWTEVALDGNYNPPDTFCWDYLCGGDNPQVQDRSDLEDRNVDRRVAQFIEKARQMAATRKGDIETMNVLWSMGRSDCRHFCSASLLTRRPRARLHSLLPCVGLLHGCVMCALQRLPVRVCRAVVPELGQDHSCSEPERLRPSAVLHSVAVLRSQARREDHLERQDRRLLVPHNHHTSRADQQRLPGAYKPASTHRTVSMCCC